MLVCIDSTIFKNFKNGDSNYAPLSDNYKDYCLNPMAQKEPKL